MQLFPFILLSSQPPLTSLLLNISAALNKNKIQIRRFQKYVAAQGTCTPASEDAN